MKWIFFRSILYICISTSAWYASQYFISRNLQQTLEAISPHAVFVDQKASINHLHTGSITYPFTTVNEALTAAHNSHISLVIVAPGIYHEKIILPDHTTLFGQGDVTITQEKIRFLDVVQTSDHSTLLNVTITGGDRAIKIPYNTSTKIINVTASDANDYGIFMEQKERESVKIYSDADIPYEYFQLTEEKIEQLPHVRFRNILVTRNQKQGMYLQDGRVTIENSHITQNGEEGIDLHPHMIATIINTDASHNGESGLETEIYDNIVTITQSTFTHNTKNGIGLITSHGVGDITIQDSIITNNATFGIRCARHKNSPDKPRPFFQSVITELDNTIGDNAGGNISEPCFLF